MLLRSTSRVHVAHFVCLTLAGCVAGADVNTDGSSAPADHFEFAEAPEIAPIIDGEESFGDEDFVVRIDMTFSDGTQSRCTGAIIHEQVVLTAQHCVGRTQRMSATGNRSRYFWYQRGEITSAIVAIGANGRTTIRATQIAIPNGFGLREYEVPQAYGEDLALLWLATPVPRGTPIANLDGITPPSVDGVDLHDSDNDANSYGDSGQFRVAGWGRIDDETLATERRSRFTRVAKKGAAALALSNEFPRNGSIEVDFHANSEQFSVLPGAICPGDSGGPAFDRIRIDARSGRDVYTGPWVVGLVSYGATGRCTNPNDYVIFQRVRSFDDFFMQPSWHSLQSFRVAVQQ